MAHKTVRERRHFLRIGYFNSIGGVSGDMLLGALVGAGLPLDTLLRELDKLNVEGYSLSENVVDKNGVMATHVSVDTSMHSNMDKPYTIQDFLDIIDQSTVSAKVKDMASGVLKTIHVAETQIHGEMHQLSELGDLDTLIDVVGVAFGLEYLGLDQIYSSPLRLGSGFVVTREGRLPVPAPAVLAIVAYKHVLVDPSYQGDKNYGEMSTPTGAAILASLASFDTPIFSVGVTSYGAGNKDFVDIPNVIGLWIGETASDVEIGEVSLLETNIDDMSPEMLGYLQEKLLQNGALDVWVNPIYMKKNRPGISLNIICKPALAAYLGKFVLLNTTTLGVRFRTISRYQADREILDIDSSIGKAQVKLKRIDGIVVGVSPEFEDCRKIAEETQLPLSDVYRIVEQECREYLGII
tara:strand:- start:9003 stop:10229 length:1227 start_codon:yes stop_codon:yes gene_type:complete